MLSQVLGMLFGKDEHGSLLSDQSSTSFSHTDSSLHPKKRGRPPSMDRTLYSHQYPSSMQLMSSSSMDIDGTEVSSTNYDMPKRKRGRPPKTTVAISSLPLTKKSSIRSDLKISGSFDGLSDSGYGTKNVGLVRRSRRYKAPEPHKDMIVIYPSDDPAIRLGVPPTEITEFNICMDDPIEMDDDEPSDHACTTESASDSHGMVVLTPGVMEINTFDDIYSNTKQPISSSSSVKSCTTSKQNRCRYDLDPSTSSSNHTIFKGLERIGDHISSYNYSTYDDDSDDEEFVSSLQSFINESTSHDSIKSSHMISISCFQFNMMIALLEREFELSRQLNPIINESSRMQSSAEHYIEESSKTLTCIKAFIDSLSETGDMTIATETLINIASEAEKNAGLPNLRVDHYTSYDDPLFSFYPQPIGSTLSQGTALSLPTPSSFNQLSHMNMQLPIARRSDDVFSPPIYSSYQIRAALMNSDIMDMLLDVLQVGCDHHSITSFSSWQHVIEVCNMSSSSEAIMIRDIFIKIVNYYITKRSSSRFSLLRCYHDFMMENWSRDAGVVPQASHDIDADYLITEESKLYMLRKDLDRARLITDRVRRREKIKRDMIRITCENLANISTTIPISSSAITSKRGQKEEDSYEYINFALEYEPYAMAINTSSSTSSSKNDDTMNISTDNRNRGRHRNSSNAMDTSLLHAPPSYNEVSQDISTKQQQVASYDNSSNKSSPSTDNHDIKAHNTSSSRRSSSSFKRSSHRSSKGQSSFSNWSLDEDRLLLLGVAACGLGRWTEIRDDFSLEYRSSAQMNQRFFRLTKRRKAYVESINNHNNTDNHHNQSSNMDTSTSNDMILADGMNDMMDETSTALQPHDIMISNNLNRNELSPVLISLLDNFNEDEIWNRISLRYLLDMHQHERRSGRPVKHPIQIPIPAEYKHRGFLKYKHLQCKRPSSPSFHISSMTDNNNTDMNVQQDGSIRSSATTTSSPSPSISCSVSEASHHSEQLQQPDIISPSSKLAVSRVSPRLTSRHH